MTTSEILERVAAVLCYRDHDAGGDDEPCEVHIKNVYADFGRKRTTSSSRPLAAAMEVAKYYKVNLEGCQSGRMERS